MADTALKARALLRNIVSHPSDYGDPIVITMFETGGLTLAPLDNVQVVDEGRRIVLDRQQTKDLSVRLNMDPAEASRIAANTITETWGAERGENVIGGFAMVAMFSALMGIGIGLLF